MTTAGIVNIVLQSFGCVVALMIILFLCVVRRKLNLLDKRFIVLLAVTAALLACNIVSWLVDGRAGIALKVIAYIDNFAALSLHIVLMAAFADYVAVYLTCHGTRPSRVLRLLPWIVAAVGIAVLTVSQFTGICYSIDDNNVYSRGPLGWLIPCLGLAGLASALLMIIYYRKSFLLKEWFAFLAYVVFTLIGVALQAVFYGSFYLYGAIIFSVICAYVFVQADQSRQLVQREADLLESRTALMLSQIQPHFLYNTLATIQALCDKEPQKASEAMEYFSYYLRGNFSFVNRNELVPFREELEHTQNYLYLEKMRYQNKLNIVYDLSAEDFCLPAMTLQPIVENAVKYGIGEKVSGGTILIKTESVAGGTELTVSDDGAGFDTDKLLSPDRQHVGIANVRLRLSSLCGGKLTIDSVRGEGTKVIISLPKVRAEKI